ncbi:uncharacterized protein BCR38DRAFT_482706 [Pseudomassariella vexata]|uniref:HAUS augmin-like complex subunit 1 n=1 Tax=Pseudomassariella vexata TaxID=1141098 RepID=A0A1Y2E6B2_9PEZI|nr:uncharacterized protein BCR38DRAFT_482706 [Pseudomassariella vexata]ORY67062.1 hypothetical protein BCR38DRAFT_482706 [Pseudomassariella vexata]
MAHRAPHLASQTAIFSPSVARAAASTAKDWAYVDSWLKAKYQTYTPPHAPPSFERNPETLRCLLALASHNEAADEERDQLARIQEAALAEVKTIKAEKELRRRATEEDGQVDGELIVDRVMEALGDGLPREGKTALDAMANMAVELGMAYPTPESLGSKFVGLQGRAFELEQTIERVAMLQRYLDAESEIMDRFVDDVQGDAYRAPEDLAKQNLELQREIKTMSAKIPELKQQVASLQKSVGMPKLTVENVKKDENEYLELLARKKHLDNQLKAFAGLPPDVDAARAVLESLRTQLRKATERRDTVFEGLVERESPVKNRRRRP